MELPRRRFLHLAAATAALPMAPRVAGAETYPARPVRIVVGFPAGGTADIVARLMGQWLSEHLRQPFIVQNQPGAASNIAVEGVVRAPADGYTLLQVVGTNATNAKLYEHLSFNFVRDIAPVAGIGRAPLVMEVNPAFPARTVPDFIAYAKASPGKINMGSAGVGSTGHIAGELFKLETGVQMQHVPYSGSAPLVTALLGSQVQVAFDLLPPSIAHIRAGRLHALAVTTAARSEALPDVPAIGDFVPGYEAGSWYGIGAPKNTPAAIVEALGREIVAAVADPAVKARLADLSIVPAPMTAAEFGKLVADETEKWGKVIRAAGIKAE
jgi:tripartite-type tricarboxylate transporter receptor subunit TctC